MDLSVSLESAASSEYNNSFQDPILRVDGHEPDKRSAPSHHVSKLRGAKGHAACLMILGYFSEKNGFVSWASWDNYSQYIPIYGKIKCYKPTTSFGILSHPQIKWSTLGTFDNWSWDTIFSSKGRQNQPWNTNLPKPWRRESMLGYEMELPRNVSDQQETTLLEEGHTQRMCCFPETRGTWSWQFHHQNLNGGSQRFFYYPLK